MSDTRTNAGVDDVSSSRKMFNWSVEGERCLTLLTAGNLATTQAVVSVLNERSVAPDDRDLSILRVPTMFQAAKLVGETLREVVETSSGERGYQAESSFNGTLILGGQIAGMEPRLFLIYPAGNFIEATDEAPFLQIGETKYGRPILLRVFNASMSYHDAVKMLYLSFDSTIKANLAVGPPLDLHIYERDRLALDRQQRIPADDPVFSSISTRWGEALRHAFDTIDDIPRV